MDLAHQKKQLVTHDGKGLSVPTLTLVCANPHSLHL